MDFIPFHALFSKGKSPDAAHAFVCRASGDFFHSIRLFFQGQTQLGAVGCAAVKHCFASMRGGNLSHQPQAGAVCGTAVRLGSSRRLALHCVACIAALHPKQKLFALCICSKPNGTAGCVVPHAVRKQIIHGSAQ